jgi:uncharacterized DUF497 family protein
MGDMAQFEFVAWLMDWFHSTDLLEFEWDDGNVTKSLKKHGISVERAEQFFKNRDEFIPLGIQMTPRVDEPRFGALGLDMTGEQLFACFTIREGRIRLISIRSMNKYERKKYASLRKE